MPHIEIDGVFHEAPIHRWFSLSYAAYFVLPRLSMVAMPIEWQEKFIALMDEAEVSGLFPEHDYTVQRKDNKGRFIKDPFCNYRRADLQKLLNKERQPK